MDAQQMLAQKRANLAKAQSSIRPDYGVLTAHARTFQNDTAQPLPAYPAPGAGPIVIASYKVPSGMTGKITGMAIVHLGAAGSFQDGSGDLLWHVLINGGPVKGLENFYVQIGSTSLPADAGNDTTREWRVRTGIILTQNNLVQVLVEVPAGMAAPIGKPFARLIGFLDYGGAGLQAPAGKAPVPTIVAATGGSTGSGASGGRYSGGGGGGPRGPKTS